MPLSRAVVLDTAVAHADRQGIDALSMRKLAGELGVVPMALYKHVANKDELLSAMVDTIVAEIPPPDETLQWKPAVRQRILQARQVMLRHPWASATIASRSQATPTVLGYIDSMVGMFLTGGLSPELTHQVMHTLGSRMWGFALEVFPAAPPPPDEASRTAMLEAMRTVVPNIVQIATAATHRDATIVGLGCDDQLEFEFGLDILLDGFERLHAKEVGVP